jgi:flagellin-like protein
MQNSMEEKEENMFYKRSLRKDGKGISPLIATLLLIAIAVAASVITYSWVMSMIGSQSQQAQTQVRIDSLTWDVANNNLTVVVRNTGSVSATVESVALRSSATGSTYYSESFTSGNSIQTGVTISLVWDETAADAAGLLAASTEYVVRVTTSTGFQYEMTATSPSA